MNSDQPNGYLFLAVYSLIGVIFWIFYLKDISKTENVTTDHMLEIVFFYSLWPVIVIASIAQKADRTPCKVIFKKKKDILKSDFSKKVLIKGKKK